MALILDVDRQLAKQYLCEDHINNRAARAQIAAAGKPTTIETEDVVTQGSDFWIRVRYCYTTHDIVASVYFLTNGNIDAAVLVDCCRTNCGEAAPAPKKQPRTRGS